MAHGANPGLVEHLVKEAMMNMQRDAKLNLKEPQTTEEWAHLSRALGINVIHIAERDTQKTAIPKMQGECVNTWSVDGFVDESILAAEAGWGTHETYKNVMQHEFGSKTGVMLCKAGGEAKVRSWVPTQG
jgi:homospermidine synthase